MYLKVVMGACRKTAEAAFDLAHFCMGNDMITQLSLCLEFFSTVGTFRLEFFSAMTTNMEVKVTFNCISLRADMTCVSLLTMCRDCMGFQIRFHFELTGR
jgi:hypothetical protein